MRSRYKVAYICICPDSGLRQDSHWVVDLVVVVVHKGSEYTLQVGAWIIVLGLINEHKIE